MKAKVRYLAKRLGDLGEELPEAPAAPAAPARDARVAPGQCVAGSSGDHAPQAADEEDWGHWGADGRRRPRIARANPNERAAVASSRPTRSAGSRPPRSARAHSRGVSFRSASADVYIEQSRYAARSDAERAGAKRRLVQGPYAYQPAPGEQDVEHVRGMPLKTVVFQQSSMATCCRRRPSQRLTCRAGRRRGARTPSWAS